MQIDPGADIVFQLHLKVARNIAFEQTKTIISCANRVCLLNDQLSALVELLQGAGNRKCQQQSYQGEYGALHRYRSWRSHKGLPSMPDGGPHFFVRYAQAEVFSSIRSAILRQCLARRSHVALSDDDGDRLASSSHSAAF